MNPSCPHPWTRIAAVACLVAAAAGLALPAEEEKPPITPKSGLWHEFDSIRGHLGLPLGTPVEVDATLVLGSMTYADEPYPAGEHQERIFLLISAIDDRPLDQPLIMSFRVISYSNTEVATTLAATMKRLNGGEDAPLPAEDVVQRFLDRKRRFIVWEEIYTSGSPPLPKGVKMASGLRPFAINAYLTIGGQTKDEGVELIYIVRRRFDPQTLTPLTAP